MKKNPFILVLLYCFFLITGRVYAVGEKIITIGSDFSWNLVEKRQGIIEAPRIRPDPVLVLAGLANSAASMNVSDDNSLDLYLSFDESRPGNFSDSRGRYDCFVSAELAATGAPWSRLGAGAAMFTGGEALGLLDSGMPSPGKAGDGPIVLKPGKSALFAAGNYVRDFSIEFWLYPMSVENGEQILSWTSSKPNGRSGPAYQRIQCIIQRNRIHWTFGDFFFSPGENERKSISFSGPPVLPRTWSHHLIRFDADLGLLEYLVDGKLEALDYATSTGREGGEVYTPVIGEAGRFVLGSRFSGMMDEFRIYRAYLGKAVLAKYPSVGGRIESRTLDLGHANSQVLKVEAFGGRTGSLQTSNPAGKVWNEYAGNSVFRFSDHSELQFFIRISNSPYRWNDVPWIPFNPGTALADSIRGRYMQLGVDFYPGENGETSPYLSELRVIYNAAEPPPPPSQVLAVAKNGAVELSWNSSPSKSVGGYLVYFGTARGEYFGKSDILESAARAFPGIFSGELKSPIDAGNRTSIRIDGLNNGTLYYFTVAAYNRPENPRAGERIILPEPGDFSREVAARPLRMTE